MSVGAVSDPWGDAGEPGLRGAVLVKTLVGTYLGNQRTESGLAIVQSRSLTLHVRSTPYEVLRTYFVYAGRTRSARLTPGPPCRCEAPYQNEPIFFDLAWLKQMRPPFMPHRK